VLQQVPGKSFTEVLNNVVQPKEHHNTPHEYELVESEGEMQLLLDALQANKEVSFDTETTGIDANEAELVGLSFLCNRAQVGMCRYRRKGPVCWTSWRNSNPFLKRKTVPGSGTTYQV
jgi:hypothetical protein